MGFPPVLAAKMRAPAAGDKAGCHSFTLSCKAVCKCFR
jgi:hypothetical protein